MHSDFSQDPLTGLPNLIKVVECPGEVFYGGRGVLIGFDLNNLTDVNSRFGRDVGDRVIQGLSHSIQRSVSALIFGGTPYRLSGDDFLVAARGLGTAEADALVEAIERRFTSYLESEGLPHATFRHARVVFPDQVHTISAVFVHLYRGLSRSPSPDGMGWVEVLVDKLFQHFSETIDQLRFVQGKALTDDISGLANHRAAMNLLEQLLDQYQRNGAPFAVLFVDGDNLKQYNEMSYDRGNELIKRLGATIQEAIRTGDRVFRWLSGDEFLVVLPGIDRESAQGVAERLRSTVAETSARWVIPVTVSVGVAACPEDACTVDELIRRATSANAEAKQLGKNRVS